MSKRNKNKVIFPAPDEKLLNGLRPRWINFISRYISNGGNGTQAYLAVYPDVTDEDVASASAARLLRNVKIREEIKNKLDAQSVTEAAIISRLWRIAQKREDKNVYAAVKALEILARIRGLLTDTKKIEFTAENPAVFLAPYTKEEAEKFKKMAEKSRIAE